MTIKIKATLTRGGNAWVFRVPKTYVDDGNLKPGQEYQFEPTAVPEIEINAPTRISTPSRARGFLEVFNPTRKAWERFTEKDLPPCEPKDISLTRYKSS